MPSEVELVPGSLVIGDLHLDVEHESSYLPFLAWLESHGDAPRLVILGDLFEFWCGPAQARVGGARRVMEALRSRVEGGTAIDIVPGNRDFLLDRSFEEATGCRIRHDGLVGALAPGTRVLFLHGDELATLDRSYQWARLVLRSGFARWLARTLPERAVIGLARRLRGTSRKAVAKKASEHMALQPDACRERAREHGADVVVCGHAHAFRDVRLADGPRWIVLDAFGGLRDTLRAGEPDPEGQPALEPL